MTELRSQAVVLRVRSFKEADKLVTLLTRDAGLVTAVARGSRKTNSKFAALLEPLTLGNFLLHQGRSLYTFIQGEIIKAYRSLQGDLVRFAYAQYFCELCERSLLEGMPSGALFMLLVTALEALEEDSSPVRVARCFEVSLLAELGISPDLSGCSNCGSRQGVYHFNPREGVLLCAACPHPVESYPVSAAAIAIMKRLQEMGFHRLSVCVIPSGESKEIHRMVADLLMHSLGISRLKTVDFLQQTGLL
ncbi:MAG: DNA repair protein RecO [Dethiobacteraceae bacterium]|jgi:DNA repair protein RecO (recombination protein O)|nr:DNA repair protein RecO [Bacillota bacterium]